MADQFAVFTPRDAERIAALVRRVGVEPISQPPLQFQGLRRKKIGKGALILQQDFFTNGSASITAASLTKFTGFTGPSAPGAGNNVYWDSTAQTFVVENTGIYQWVATFSASRGGVPGTNLGPCTTVISFIGNGLLYPVSQYALGWPEFNFPSGPGGAQAVKQSVTLNQLENVTAGKTPFFHAQLTNQIYGSTVDPLVHDCSVIWSRLG